MELNRNLELKAAYDCVVNQPCKFGSPTCKPNTGGSHGRYPAELILSVENDSAELLLVVVTDWYMSNTMFPSRLYLEKDTIWDNSCWLNTHTSYSTDNDSWRYDYDKWGTCYSNSFPSTLAQEPKRLLIDEGSEACYKWLENNFSRLVPSKEK